MTTIPIESVEKDFESELALVKEDIDTAVSAYYTYKSIFNTAAQEPEALRALNCNRMFWNITMYSFQCTYFIALGRLFDRSSPHNVDRLVKIAQDNPLIFSRDALRRRRKKNYTGNYDLDEYIKNAYEPTSHDFRKIRKEISSRRKAYGDSYQHIRNKIFAHKELGLAIEKSQAFGKTSIGEFENLLLFIYSVHRALQMLLINGHKPVLEKPDPSLACTLIEYAEKDVKNLIDKLQ